MGLYRSSSNREMDTSFIIISPQKFIIIFRFPPPENRSIGLFHKKKKCFQSVCVRRSLQIGLVRKCVSSV